jgi:hypothetical protein
MFRAKIIAAALGRRDDGLGQAAYAQVAPGKSRATPQQLDWTGPTFSNTIRWQPCAHPGQKHDPGSGYGAKRD